jgi:hypothetical protein
MVGSVAFTTPVPYPADMGHDVDCVLQRPTANRRTLRAGPGFNRRRRHQGRPGAARPFHLHPDARQLSERRQTVAPARRRHRRRPAPSPTATQNRLAPPRLPTATPEPPRRTALPGLHRTRGESIDRHRVHSAMGRALSLIRACAPPSSTGSPSTPTSSRPAPTPTDSRPPDSAARKPPDHPPSIPARPRAAARGADLPWHRANDPGPIQRPLNPARTGSWPASRSTGGSTAPASSRPSTTGRGGGPTTSASDPTPTSTMN